MTPDDAARLAKLRGRLLSVGDEPDVAAAVMARIAGGGRAAASVPGPRRRVIPFVAAAVAGIVIGATLVSGGGPGRRPPSVAADVSQRVLSAQTRVDTLSADVKVLERGWQRSVPLRAYTGHLRYRAPEALALDLTDHSRYPSAAWARNNITLVVDSSRAWDRGPVPCPPGAEPACAPPTPRLRATIGREPFAADVPAPLDLVVPARSFSVAGPTPSLGDRTIDGRAAVGVRTTAAQIDPLLSGLRRAGNWREVYPADRVDMWLDKGSLVPLLVDVYAAGGEDHRAWAAARGYVDRPGEQLLSLELLHVVVNGVLPDGSFPSAPPDAVVTDGGFRDTSTSDVRRLPPGMRPHRAGVTTVGPEVTARSFSDGLAWVKVRSTTAWTSRRLFGHDADSVVRRTTLLGGGVAYVAEGGQRILVHGEGVDVEVTGSVAAEELMHVAAGLGVRGMPVPGDWAEASASTLAGARAVLSGLLLPRRAPGFAPPAIRVDGGIVTLGYAGAGARGFQLIESLGTTLTPPLSSDVRGVAVRSVAGRFSPDQGSLEWVEGGRLVELRSRTLSIGELLAVAEGLGPAP
jgi:hypothetical protein